MPETSTNINMTPGLAKALSKDGTHKLCDCGFILPKLFPYSPGFDMTDKTVRNAVAYRDFSFWLVIGKSQFDVCNLRLRKFGSMMFGALRDMRLAQLRFGIEWSVDRRKVVFPNSSLDDCRNQTFCNVVLQSQGTLGEKPRGVVSSNLIHVGARQLRASVGFAFGLAIFAYSIIHIFLIGSQKQVRRVATRGIVTSMTNVFVCRGAPVFDCIRNSVSAVWGSIDNENGILGIVCSQHWPARIQFPFVGAHPKPLSICGREGWNWFSHRRVLCQ